MALVGALVGVFSLIVKLRKALFPALIQYHIRQQHVVCVKSVITVCKLVSVLVCKLVTVCVCVHMSWFIPV